jgi:hypothetical protein
LKDIVPVGKLIYDKEPYSVYEVDGDDQKVNVLFYPVNHYTEVVSLTLPPPTALLPEPLPLRKTLPRQQIRLLRRLHFSLLSSRLYLSSEAWFRTVLLTSPSSYRLLLQGEDELG